MSGGYEYNLGLAFEAVAAEAGEAIAIRYLDADPTTFVELERRANAIAHALAKEGVERGSVVAILNKKSVDGFAVMLGCLKLGAAYTNLDDSSPTSRLGKVLGTCEPHVLVSDTGAEELGESLGSDFGVKHLELAAGDFRDAIDSAPTSSPASVSEVIGSDPAYIMFTSGSTGTPKGATISHANVLNFISWGKQAVGVDRDDRFTNVNPIYFDNSVFDFYVSLFNGASLCPVSSDLTNRPRDLVRAIEALGCTVWFSVPSMLVYLLNLRALGTDDFSSIRAIVFGGEGFPKKKLRDLHALYGERMRLINVYGPTECTCICSAYDVSSSDFDKMSELAPLGLIASNFDYQIDPVGPMEPDFGELLLAGPSVGLGYFNDPIRTQQSFVPNPAGGRYISVWYRTGDLVRRDELGRLHFKGRVDNQIKHNGYRIEIEEVEIGISTLAGVDEAAAIYWRINEDPGDIIAFVSGKGLDPRQLRQDLRDILPPYMIPRRVELMDKLPKNRNGKIDRRALIDTLK